MRASAQKARPIHSLEKKKGKAANMVLFNTIIDYFTENNLYVNESDLYVKTATKVVGILRDVLCLTDGHEVAAGEWFIQDLKGFAYEKIADDDLSTTAVTSGDRSYFFNVA